MSVSARHLHIYSLFEASSLRTFRCTVTPPKLSWTPDSDRCTHAGLDADRLITTKLLAVVIEGGNGGGAEKGLSRHVAFRWPCLRPSSFDVYRRKNTMFAGYRQLSSKTGRARKPTGVDKTRYPPPPSGKLGSVRVNTHFTGLSRKLLMFLLHPPPPFFSLLLTSLNC